MRYHKIHAYIRFHRLEEVEEMLQKLGVSGFSFCRVKGTGEYANYYNTDHYTEHARLEIFVPEDQVNDIVSAIVETAETHTEGDGLVAVMPVERVVRIRNHEEMTANTSPEERTSG